jgi:hypothetical protein
LIKRKNRMRNFNSRLKNWRSNYQNLPKTMLPKVKSIKRRLIKRKNRMRTYKSSSKKFRMVIKQKWQNWMSLKPIYRLN